MRGGGVPVWLVSTLPTSFESRSRLRRKQMQCTDPSASHEVLASNHSQLAPSGFSPEGVPAFLWVSDAFARAARQALQACANPTSWGLTGLGAAGGFGGRTVRCICHTPAHLPLFFAGYLRESPSLPLLYSNFCNVCTSLGPPTIIVMWQVLPASHGNF